ncbi:PAAR domain-containing protein, partial [Acerihabitans sp. TG2]|uniref:PAAR domain-containing protein n=1 Tax=Acerihabitans sp. TG2 TaxID=3096008 RepID=UPI002B22B96A
MAIGYWIVKGDKTSCGGRVLEGMQERRFADNPVAVNGSKVSCGKHPGNYYVAGGHRSESVHGHFVASTLYSRSTCPCEAWFIPSQTWASHGPYRENTPRVVASSAASVSASEPEQHAQAARKNAASDTHDDGKTPKKKREITLTIGVFFDGTGNNAN